MIYIQSRIKNKLELPYNFECACSMYGAIDNELDFKLIDFNEIKNGNYDNFIKTNLFIGSVDFMREVFKRVDIKDVRLPKNSNRESEIITLSEAHNRVYEGEKIFIKPVEIKLFTGLVLDGYVYTCLNGLPPETKVMAYEVFKNKIISEWRVYVFNHRIEGSKNYSGDCIISPFYDYVQSIINDNKIEGFPCAYTIDVGILSPHDMPNSRMNAFENVVIEFNDMWAIGNYGLDNITYLRMLKERYFEIIRNK